MLLLLVVASCSDHHSESVGSDGPVVFRQRPSWSEEGAAAEVKGVLSYDEDHGCFFVTLQEVTYAVVWPAGTTGVAEGTGVQLPNGLVIGVGSSDLGDLRLFGDQVDMVARPAWRRRAACRGMGQDPTAA